MKENFLTDNTDRLTPPMRGALRYCIEKGSCSIADFSRELNISVPTATKIVSDLIEGGCLMDEGKLDTSGGRKPSIYGLNPAAGYFLGVDIARQHFHIAVTDFRGDEIFFFKSVFLLKKF